MTDIDPAKVMEQHRPNTYRTQCMGCEFDADGRRPWPCPQYQLAKALTEAQERVATYSIDFLVGVNSNVAGLKMAFDQMVEREQRVRAVWSKWLYMHGTPGQLGPSYDDLNGTQDGEGREVDLATQDDPPDGPTYGFRTRQSKTNLEGTP